MVNKSHVVFAVFVLLLGSSFLFAQSSNKFKIEEFDHRVAIKDRGPIMVDSAFMEKSVRDEGGELREVFQLSFFIPKRLEDLLDKTTLKLTAYNQDGKVFGMRVWHKISQKGAATEKGDIPIVLEVNSEFAKAARFSLEAGVLEISAHNGETATASASCPGCVDLAVSTCGEGKVASVKCGTTKDGSSCEFTCKP